MKTLICIGENYRDFAPLNQYAQNTARVMFGTLDSLFFVCKFDNIRNTLKTYRQCLVVAPKAIFGEILKAFGNKSVNVESININAMCVKNAELQMYLLDLQSATQEELTQVFSAHGVVESFGDAKSLLYLYPLGIDATSLQMLLGGITEEFGVNVNVLNAESHLDILSAQGGDLQSFKEAVKVAFGEKVFLTFDLARSVIELLEGRNLKITSAESCTGGLIATTLTRKSGASVVFDGAVISYANAIKETWLGVSAENLASFGAVSEAVVRDMLDGALKLSKAHFALATSGVAGPSGGSVSKPVGTVYIGAKSIEGVEIIERLQFRGNRNFIQEQATLYAYLLFLKIFFKNY
ncbi:CinA family protein [Helicobacter turcicus]|uniref:CinA family protein n=1 Tax=Helicobacter turcicus TaxID=2867412 RepID=A0ABS7JNU0_9HELI|nr:CinA family protein [Helicobacter turcicus]MBX7491073.1 CinA family protein [Helicobacter turcicus]MBX7545938.1 CinA family protein [Helicobacter turcicus]